MKAEFFYKVFGLTEDTETGELDYGYVRTSMNNDDDLPVDVDVETWEKTSEAFKQMLVNEYGFKKEDITVVTKKEYQENTEED